MISINNLIRELKRKGNKEKAKILQNFFKTEKGEYGEGDVFLGITVPESRKIAKKYTDLKLIEISKLLKNKYHEIRLVAILILIAKYKDNKKEIYNFYLFHTKYINNWDLVDLSAHHIIGDYLLDKDREILLKLAKSKSLWERRIAIISTFAFIYNKESEWTLKLSKILINDPQDLIQKACGWMLREVGKKVSEAKLCLFLDDYGTKMPRTMLRYSIERFNEPKRLKYLNMV